MALDDPAPLDPDRLAKSAGPRGRWSDLRRFAQLDLELLDESARPCGVDAQLGRDRALGRTVAVRGLPPDDAIDSCPSAARDVLVAGALQHPNVPTVYGLGLGVDDVPLVATRLPAGRSWTDILADDRAAAGDPDPEAYLERHLGTFLRVCDAVAFAHDRGVIHRGIATERVSVGAFGDVVLGGWGLAAAISADGVACNAPPLAAVDPRAGPELGRAPEQLEGIAAAIGPWTDVFHLAGMLYEILTGARPWEHTSVGEVGAAPSDGDPGHDVARRLLPWLVERVPSDLLQVVGDGLASDPAARIRDVAALRLRVENALEEVRARSESRALRRQALEGVAECRAALLAARRPPPRPRAWWEVWRARPAAASPLPDEVVQLIGRAPETVLEIEATLAALGRADRDLQRALQRWPGNPEARASSVDVLRALAAVAAREDHYPLQAKLTRRLASHDREAAASVEAFAHGRAFRKDGPLRALWSQRWRARLAMSGAVCLGFAFFMEAQLLVAEASTGLLGATIFVLLFGPSCASLWLAGWFLRQGSRHALRLAARTLWAALALLLFPGVLVVVASVSPWRTTGGLLLASLVWLAVGGFRTRPRSTGILLRAVLGLAPPALCGSIAGEACRWFVAHEGDRWLLLLPVLVGVTLCVLVLYAAIFYPMRLLRSEQIRSLPWTGT